MNGINLDSTLIEGGEKILKMMNSIEDNKHPYLTGNFAPIKRELPLTPCKIIQGSIPIELSGGQYVRNGGNPMKDEDEKRQAHWFDGDGMLTGILFQQKDEKGEIKPYFINRFILTDILISTSKNLKRPFLPSITTFASEFTIFNLIFLICQIMRTLILSFLSWLPFQQKPSLKRISAANTSIWWHDGQAFAGCESGPPIRILLPGLETADWWTGEDEIQGKGGWSKGSLGPIKMLKEFTTAHPRIDPITNELLLYHMSFAFPYLRISVIPTRKDIKEGKRKAILGEPVPGLSRPKLAHDFCATSKRTILIDMPLILDPKNLLFGKPMLSFDQKMKTRFGIFPRRSPDQVKWYESESCCIYHAANAWDDEQENTNLVACRLNSATLVYAAGNLETPKHAKSICGKEKCQLYYWQFTNPSIEINNDDNQSEQTRQVKREFALSDIPVEFPTMNDQFSQRSNKFVYGASMTTGSFDAGLGSRSAKIDCLAKFDIQSLIKRGKIAMDSGNLEKGESVDKRTVQEILLEQSKKGEIYEEEEDDIRLFALPPYHYAQEATFIAKQNAKSEDDGFLIFFVFDESVGLDHEGECLQNSLSQLWILDAITMNKVVCKIQLPQRVPYGLHGHFFSVEEIQNQTPVNIESVRNWALASKGFSSVGLNGIKSQDESINFFNLPSLAVFSFRNFVERLLA